MLSNPTSALESLIKAITIEERQRLAKPAPCAQVVTLSTGAGAGGKEVARLLGERLQIPVFDKAILNAIAKEAHIEKHVLERLDERVEGLKGAWLRYLITGESLFKDTYRRNLINVILSIACHNGIILGRGANFVLAHLPVLRVRIVGTKEPCVARVATEEDIDPNTAERRVEETDKERRKFIRKFYERKINDPTGYDVVLNSDRLELTRIADLVLLALKDFNPNMAEG
jgi:cytidylate kinase